MLLGAATLIARAARRARRHDRAVLSARRGRPRRRQAMVEDGLLERFGIERAYGLHLASAFPTGIVGFREGPFYASSDSIEITIEGPADTAPRRISRSIRSTLRAHSSSPFSGRLAANRSARAGGRDDRGRARGHDPQRDSVARDAAGHGARVRRRRAREDGRADRARPARRVRERRRDVRVRRTCAATRSPPTTPNKTRYVRALAEREVGDRA